MTDPSPPILVGVDFSENGRKAFDAAMSLAEDMDTQLVIVHVYPEMKAPPLIAGDLAKEVMDEARAEVSKEEAMILAQDWVAVARKRGLDVDVVADDGTPHEVIIAEAKSRGAALIVVGTHGRSGVKRLLLGSVAQNVIHHSDRPVLVVPRSEKK